ncbi:hypothetical protein FB451DRAFT_1251637 [Mycena latifolia]|nr:hypothetical protein FB451DRAFT_1251637 [Mycena latifolia]
MSSLSHRRRAGAAPRGATACAGSSQSGIVPITITVTMATSQTGGPRAAGPASRRGPTPRCPTTTQTWPTATTPACRCVRAPRRPCRLRCPRPRRRHRRCPQLQRLQRPLPGARSPHRARSSSCRASCTPPISPRLQHQHCPRLRQLRRQRRLQLLRYRPRKRLPSWHRAHRPPHRHRRSRAAASTSWAPSSPSPRKRPPRPSSPAPAPRPSSRAPSPPPPRPRPPLRRPFPALRPLPRRPCLRRPAWEADSEAGWV